MPDSPLSTLPVVQSPLSPEAIVERMDKLSKRGKLAGFAKGVPPTLFEASAFGDPLEYRLLASAEPETAGTRVSFALKLPAKIPLIYALVITLSIWPGVWLTHSMLITYFSWYKLTMTGTCAWYLPLTILPLPWMYKKQFVGSRAAALADATDLIQKLATELDARVVPEQRIIPSCGTGTA